MNRSIITLSVSVLLAATLPSGALAQDSGVNCDTAKEDIAHLQHEKKSTEERKVKGVMSIMPIGLAINATEDVTEGSADKQKEMDINEYNEKLDARIAEIKKACGV